VQVRTGTSDFLFQINRPTTSRGMLTDLKINRLTKWSAFAWQLTLVANRGSVSSQQIEGPKTFGVRLELDINSTGERQEELPASHLIDLWRELIGIGRAIAAEGDKS